MLLQQLIVLAALTVFLVFPSEQAVKEKQTKSQSEKRAPPEVSSYFWPPRVPVQTPPTWLEQPIGSSVLPGHASTALLR